LTYKP